MHSKTLSYMGIEFKRSYVAIPSLGGGVIITYLGNCPACQAVLVIRIVGGHKNTILADIHLDSCVFLEKNADGVKEARRDIRDMIDK